MKIFLVAAYDIRDNKRRRRVFRVMRKYGERVQYSVFECYLNHAEIDEMVAEVKRHIDRKDDRVSVYTLCHVCERKVKNVSGKKSERPEDIMIV